MTLVQTTNGSDYWYKRLMAVIKLWLLLFVESKFTSVRISFKNLSRLLWPKGELVYHGVVGESGIADYGLM